MEQWVYNGVEFREGDRVKIVRDAEDYDPNGMGAGVTWKNGWIHTQKDDGLVYPHMDGYIGLEFEIEFITEHGAFFTAEDNSFGFPLSCMINLTQRGNLPTVH